MQTAAMATHTSPARRLACLAVTLLAAASLLLGLHRPPPGGRAPASRPSASVPLPSPALSSSAAPSRLELAHRAWQRFLDGHPSYDPLAEFLVSSPLGLPAAEPVLEEALDLLEPALTEAGGPGRIEVARLASQVLQALRNERSHRLLREFVPRLVRDYPRDDPRVAAAILQCLDAALTPPREWADPDRDDGVIRRRTVESLKDVVAVLAASETSPSRGALWRCCYVTLLHCLGHAVAVTEPLIEGTDVAALPPDQVWRYHYVRTRLAERDRRWDELPALNAAGLASAPSPAVRIYFANRLQQVRLRSVMRDR